MYQFHISRSVSGPRIPLSSPPVEIIVLARREPEALIKAKAVSPDDRDGKRYSYEITKIVEISDEFETANILTSEYSFETKEEAAVLRDQLRRLGRMYEVVSMHDLKELLGVGGITYADSTMGWVGTFDDLRVIRVGSKYSLNLPHPVSI